MCDDGCGKPRAVYFKVDSSRISKVEPRVVARPYTLLNLEVLYWREKMNVFIASSSSDAALEK